MTSTTAPSAAIQRTFCHHIFWRIRRASLLNANDSLWRWSVLSTRSSILSPRSSTCIASNSALRADTPCLKILCTMMQRIGYNDQTCDAWLVSSICDRNLSICNCAHACNRMHSWRCMSDAVLCRQRLFTMNSRDAAIALQLTSLWQK